MRTTFATRLRHAACGAAIAALAGTAGAVNGPQPASSDTRFDAVCGIGGSTAMIGGNGVVGSGVLIHPRVVLSNRHIFVKGRQPAYGSTLYFTNDTNEWEAAPGLDGTYSSIAVRFWRGDDDVAVGGTLDECADGLDPNLDANGLYPPGPSATEYFHVGVQEIIRPVTAANDDNKGYMLLILEHDVTHIDPIPLYEGGLAKGLKLRTYAAGFGYGTNVLGPGGNLPPQGHLRFSGNAGSGTIGKIGGSYSFAGGGGGGGQIYPGNGTVHTFDSGSAYLAEDACGDLSVICEVNITETDWPGNFVRGELAFGEPLPYNADFLAWLGLARGSGRELDVTGSARSGDVTYGQPDMLVDEQDLLYVAGRLLQADSAWDLTTSGTVPGDASYDSPDGVLDSHDYLHFARRFQEACPMGYSAGKSRQIRPTPTYDVSPDGRWDSNDALVVARLAALGTFGTDPAYAHLDLDGNSVFNFLDSAVFTLATSHDAALPFGDADGNRVVDADDLVVVNADVAAFAVANPGQALFGDAVMGSTGYVAAYDLGGGGKLDLAEYDSNRLRTIGDVGDSGFPLATGQPDGVVDGWDRASYLSEWNQLLMDAGGTISSDVTGTLSPSDPFYLVADGKIDIADIAAIVARSGGPTPLDAGVLDLNGAGRMNVLDWVAYENGVGCVPGPCPSGPLLGPPSLANLGMPASLNDDSARFFSFFDPVIQSDFFFSDLPFNHGVLGDYNRDAGVACASYVRRDLGGFPTVYGRYILSGGSPADCVATSPGADCADLDAIVADVAADVINFDGAYLGEDGYFFELDADLDGDLDLRDRIAVYQLFEPADWTTDGTSNGVPDGRVTISDFTYYQGLWSANDLAADVTTDGTSNGIPDGIVTFSDFVYYQGLWSAAPNCP